MCGLPSRSNVLGNSINKEIHHESTEQRKVMKYKKKKKTATTALNAL